MSINSIGSSAASWAQFVKITQAARERNGGGFSVNGAGGGIANIAGNANNANTVNKGDFAATLNQVQETNVVSFKKAFDVYSNKLTKPVQDIQASTMINGNRKTAGGLFDAYA